MGWVLFGMIMALYFDLTNEPLLEMSVLIGLLVYVILEALKKNFRGNPWE
jgi:hypothetical protein